MLFFGALLVWRIDDRAQVATETIVGVIFSAASAIGSMLASGEKHPCGFSCRDSYCAWLCNCIRAPRETGPLIVIISAIGFLISVFLPSRA